MGVDLFDFWRWFLATACTIYAVIVSSRWVVHTLRYLSGRERTTSLLRRYLVLQALRLRLDGFARELGLIVFWACLLVVILSIDAAVMAR